MRALRLITTGTARGFFGLTGTRDGCRVTGTGCTGTSALCVCTRKQCGVNAVDRGRVLRLRLGGLARRAGYVGTHVRIRGYVRRLHSCLNVRRSLLVGIEVSGHIPSLRVSLSTTLVLTGRGDPRVRGVLHHGIRDRDTISHTGTGTKLGTSVCLHFNLARATSGLGSTCQGPLSRRCIDLNVALPVLS